MNRIKLGPLAAEHLETGSLDDPKTEHPASASLLNVAQRWTTGEHSLFVPMHYESGYAYPLIIWLHGDDSDCSELQKYMPEISVRNYVGVAPQSGFAASSPISWPNCEESIDAAYESVMTAVDEARMRFNINDSRVYIAGVGTGGTMALQLAFERPDVFAGVISVDGPMDTQSLPLRDLERSRHLPVLLSAFRESETWSQDELCHNLRLLYVGGFSTTVRQYPGSLDLSHKVLSDIDRWIMEQFESAIS